MLALNAPSRAGRAARATDCDPPGAIGTLRNLKSKVNIT